MRNGGVQIRNRRVQKADALVFSSIVVRSIYLKNITWCANAMNHKVMNWSWTRLVGKAGSGAKGSPEHPGERAWWRFWLLALG